MAVRAIKNEPRCKFCQHPDRIRIDEILEMRSLGKKDPETGQRYNGAYVKKVLREKLGIDNPTDENIKIHWGKHCQWVPDAQMEAADDYETRIAIELAEQYEQQGEWTLDNFARRMVEIAGHKAQRTLKEGKLPAVTLDQVKGLIDTSTKRKQSDSQNQLVDALTRGIAGAVGKKVLEPAPLELEEAADDAEYEEVE